MERPTPEPEAVLVLAGGGGRRIGAPKAWLPWAGRPLLLHVLARLSPLAPDRVWVAGRAGQELPAGRYRRVDDELDDAGPLAGLAAGLEALAAEAPRSRVAVAACDYPFADPVLFLALSRARPAADLVLPRWAGHLHPLQGIWGAGLGARCREAVTSGVRRVRDVVDAVHAEIVEAGKLGGVDPARALLNVNDAEDLARARAWGEEA